MTAQAGVDEIVRTRERARELFGAGSELAETTPLPFAMTAHLRAIAAQGEPVVEVVVEPDWFRYLSGGICQTPDESDAEFRERVKRLLEIP